VAMPLSDTSCIILGSSQKQAHIIDKDTSVYSQHCAVVHCKQTAPLPSALFVYPLGGQTKVWTNRHFSLLREENTAIDNAQREAAAEAIGQAQRSDEEKAKEEKERMDKVKEFYMKEDFKSAVLPLELIPKLETSRQEEAEILFEGERRYPLDIDKSSIQLGSSGRVYIFDLKQWTPLQEEVVVVESKKSRGDSPSPSRNMEKRSKNGSTPTKAWRGRSVSSSRSRKDTRGGSRSRSRRRSKSREKLRRSPDRKKCNRDSVRSKSDKKKNLKRKKSKKDKSRKEKGRRSSRRSNSSSSSDGSKS